MVKIHSKALPSDCLTSKAPCLIRQNPLKYLLHKRLRFWRPFSGFDRPIALEVPVKAEEG